MTTFGPPLSDIASQNRDFDNDPGLRFGVQNARADRKTRNQTLTSRPSEDGRRKRMAPTYQGAYESNENETARNQQVENRYIQDNEALQNQQLQTTSTKIKAPKVVVSLAIKNTAIAWMIITNSWAGTMWIFVQFWAGLISSLFFGLTAAVTYSYFGDVISTVAMWFGYTQPNLMSLGFWGLITAAGVGWISLLIAVMHAKFWLLHPLLGRKGALKTGTFLIAVVLYSIPLLNMVPWIFFWSWIVKIYPK